MGDVLTLIEKATEAMDLKEQEKIARAKQPTDLTLEDFLDQMQQLKKMGPLQNVLGMLPGVGNKLKNAEIDDDAMKKPEAIIQSMTPRERRNPDVLNASRRKRIAAGAGVTVQDVNQLMRQFDQMRKMMKQMMGNKRGLARGMRNFPGMM
jgi:signal recognition particle subunit SRP54